VGLVGLRVGVKEGESLEGACVGPVVGMAGVGLYV